jgi:O-antigen/teichoic acid export membrane protein
MKDRIAKAVFWIVWTRGGVQVLSFCSTLLVIRLLSPSDYGLMALAGIWTATLSLVTEMGLGAAIIQFRDLGDRDLNACFWITLGLGILGYGVLFLLAPMCALWFNSPELSSVLRVSGVSLPLTALRTVPDSLLRKRLAMDKVSLAEFAATLATFPLVLGLAWKGAGVWALVAGTLMTPFMQVVVTGWYVQWWPGLQIGGERLKDMVTYSLATLGSRVSWALYQQADTLVLGKLGGEHVLGLYTMAKQLATLPVSKVTPLVNQLAFPVMAELQDDDQALRACFLKGVRLVSAVVFPLSLGLLMVADNVVALGLDAKWDSITPMFQLLCLYAIVSALATLLFPPLSVKRRLDLQLTYTTAQLIVMPIGFFVGASLGGGIGVALIWVILYPLQLVWLAHWALRELGLTWQEFLRHLWPQTLAAAGMVLVILLVKNMLEATSIHTSWLQLALCIAAGASAYTLALKMSGPRLFSEMLEIAGWVLGRRRTFTPRPSTI